MCLFTYAMFPELFDHSQAEDVGYLCVHGETGGQDVSILTRIHRKKQTYTQVDYFNVHSGWQNKNDTSSSFVILS